MSLCINEDKVVKKLISIIMSLIIILSCISVVNAKESAKVYTDKVVMENGREIPITSSAFVYKIDKEYLYLPIDEILPSLGVTLGWDSERNAEICIANGEVFYVFPNRNEVLNNQKMEWLDSPSIIKDGVFYISNELIEYLTGIKMTAPSALEEYGIITVISGSKKAFANGRETELEGEPYIYNGKLFVPLDSTLNSCGFALGWDSETSSVICYKNGDYSYIHTNEGKIRKNGTELYYDYLPISIFGVMYISDEMLKAVANVDAVAYGTPKSYRDRNSIFKTSRTDKYRLSGKSVVRGGGVTVVDGFGMELVSASATDAQKYAGVINAVADSLENVNVYNILVPTSAEFFAPLSLYPNQLSGIQEVYKNLSNKVTPVNVYDALSEHCDEKIYFATDHHWTQRGAYYAYKAFIEMKGGAIDSLDSFVNVPSYNHIGSFASFARGTAAGNIMRNSPELLERFMPKFATVGTVFSDCAVTKPQYTVKAVNTQNNAYSCFIGGDAPVTVFYTDAPGDESIVIIKESFGNAFATWAMHNYKKVCVVDPRKFNGFGGNYARFNLNEFCKTMDIDDVVFINYPVVISSSGIRSAILNMR